MTESKILSKERRAEIAEANLHAHVGAFRPKPGHYTDDIDDLLAHADALEKLLDEAEKAIEHYAVMTSRTKASQVADTALQSIRKARGGKV